MENSEILNRISVISENLDPRLFAEIVSTLKVQIKSEKQKQEVKLIIEEVIQGLVRVVYDLEDERLENDFYDLMEELVVLGIDIGKILIGEFGHVKNSEQQTKVIEMIDKTLKASSWIRKILFAQRLDPVISQLLSQNTPIRIKQMLQNLRAQLEPYLRSKDKTNSKPISLTLHADKTFIIQEWLKNPEVFIDNEPVVIEGISMLDFLTREVNFEIFLDYILFSHEYGFKVLAAFSQVVPHFKRFKKFNPLKKISECVLSALSSNNSEFTALQAVKLLKVLFKNDNLTTFNFLVTESCVNVFLKNFGFPQVRSFFFVYLVANRHLTADLQEVIKNKILSELFKKFSVLILGDSLNDQIAVLDFLSTLLPEVLHENFTAKADEFEAGEALSLHKYRKSLLTNEGISLISALFNLLCKEYWCSSNSPTLQEIQFKDSEIICVLIKSFHLFKPLKGILSKSITDDLFIKLQGSILHYSLNNDKPSFRLPTSLVIRPVGSHMIQLAKTFSEILKFKPDLTVKVSTNCWSSVFLWFFVFKNNGMFLFHNFSAICLMFDFADEKIVKEVLFDKKFIFKIVESLLEKNLENDEKDFFYFCKRIGKKICEYTEFRKNKLTKDILAVPKWKTLFPPALENASRTRPSTRGGSKGHTFILGLDPLEKNQPKAVPKQEHEVEHLASQLDLIYKFH